MIFNSYIFVFLYLPVTVLLYHLINSRRQYKAGKLFLLAASVLFYCSGDAAALPILASSIIINYLFYLWLRKVGDHKAAGRLILFVSVTFNLLTLFYFKYLGFFADIAESLLHKGITAKEVILPLGISYFTFSQIAFLVDCYRDPDAEYAFLDYALFISFFPKISVGPITFAGDLIPQFHDPERLKWNAKNMAGGLVIFAAGLAKKVLIADNMAPYVTWGYSNIGLLGTTNAVLVMVAYTMQIYFDFSGYCDMVKAVCLMLNLDIPDNFLSPYRAVSVEEFWKRWHITLTSFFTKYVYIPMGGNRRGRLRTYLNMIFIFFLSGLWHGASYNFIIWGLLNGAGIILSKLLKGRMVKLPVILRRTGTFIFANIAWIFFRAPTLKDASDFLAQLFSMRFIPVNIELAAQATPDELQFFQWMILTGLNKTPYFSGCAIALILLIAAVSISMYCMNATERLAALQYNGRTTATTVILLVLSIMSMSGVSEFIYTNF